MIRELTDVQILAAIKASGYETWDSRMWVFARFVIKADRALRVPMTPAEMREVYTKTVPDVIVAEAATFRALLRAAEAFHGIAS